MLLPRLQIQMSYSTGWTQNVPDPCSVVLDTNVILDWLLFRDPRCKPIDSALTTGRLRLLSDALCVAELLDVLSRPKVCDDPARATAIAASYKEHALDIDLALPLGQDRKAGDLPQCRDPSDQKFLELASRSGAHLLVTRDRELLVLAKPAWQLLNLAIVSLNEASAGILELLAGPASSAAN